MERKSWMIAGLGCGAGCLVLAVLVGIPTGLWFGRAMRGPKDVVVRVDAPIETALKQPITLEVAIENRASRPQTLDSIDLASSYLEGLAVASSEPPFTGSMNMGVLSFHTYDFQRPIPPGETLTVRFQMNPVHAGDFSGDLDVCINSEAVCTTQVVRTVVREAG